MATKVRAGGVWQDITAGKLFHNGAWRALRKILVYSGGAWRTAGDFIASLTASVSPDTLTAACWTSNPVAVTGETTATASGGASPFTYAWTLVSSNSTNTPTALKPSFATTAFRLDMSPEAATATSSGTHRTAVFRCTITDSLGSTATADVTVTFSVYEGSEPTGSTL